MADTKTRRADLIDIGAIKPDEQDFPSVRALNSDADSFFGCTFPLTYTKFGGSTGGFFPRASTLKEQAYSNLKNLLLTMKGERLGEPEFGSDLPSLLFEPNTNVTSDSVEEAIREAVGIWLNYIEIQNVYVTRDDYNVNVQIEFSVTLDDPDAIEVLNISVAEAT